MQFQFLVTRFTTGKGKKYLRQRKAILFILERKENSEILRSCLCCESVSCTCLYVSCTCLSKQRTKLARDNPPPSLENGPIGRRTVLPVVSQKSSERARESQSQRERERQLEFQRTNRCSVVRCFRLLGRRGEARKIKKGVSLLYNEERFVMVNCRFIWYCFSENNAFGEV